jgi:hypothetical protein
MLSMGIYVDDALADEPWVMACTLSEYDCTSLTPPEVSRSSSRLLGAYTFGGPAIVRISRDLRWGSNHYRMVLAHEYTHYLQDVVGDDVLNTMTICEIEAEAWHVGNTYAKLLNSPRLVDTEWSELYDDC